mgnify:CR=1 FL=1
MKVQVFESHDEWMAGRRGKITGSRLKDVVAKRAFTKEEVIAYLTAKGIEHNPKAKKEELEMLLTAADIAALTVKAEKKIGFYELIAERLGIPSDDESAMDRGHRLEPQAIEEFEKATNTVVDRSLVIWSREDNESIAVSPDGIVSPTEAVEVKCLSSANHIKAVLTKQIPDEYEFQKLQYFIVNDKLKKLYFVFYDPRLLAKPFFVIEVNRSEVQADVDKYLAYQKAMVAEVEAIVNELSGF